MKKTTLSFTALALTGVLMVSAAAAGVSQIKAELRSDIKVVIDGREQTLWVGNGKRLYPITCDGAVYLPVQALEEVLDREVEWNGKTVTLTRSGRDRPAPDSGHNSHDRDDDDHDDDNQDPEELCSRHGGTAAREDCEVCEDLCPEHGGIADVDECGVCEKLYTEQLRNPPCSARNREGLSYFCCATRASPAV